MLKLGELIRQKRRELGMTQADLAKKAGVTLGYIGKIEIGHKAGFNTLLKIAQILGIPSDEVLNDNQEVFRLLESFPHMNERYNKEFSELSPTLKSLLLKLAPIIEKYL